MIRTAESIDRTRHERIMGWYHSHPFDVGTYSNCFLSSTDIQTQLNYQRTEDSNGNPWLAIVVDPLRSITKKQPEIKAFRAYPPNYHPKLNECPDGKIIREETLRLEMWGKSWSSYYELTIEYYMSSAARKMMSLLTQNYFWMNMLCTTPSSMTISKRKDDEYPKKINAVADQIRIMEATITSTSNNQNPLLLRGGGSGGALGVNTSSSSISLSASAGGTGMSTSNATTSGGIS